MSLGLAYLVALLHGLTVAAVVVGGLAAVGGGFAAGRGSRPPLTA
jgi:hypothetical protein